MKEPTLQPLSPREIQARVRAGASPADVAADTGWPLDKVERYAQPPLGERAYVAEQARSVEISRSRGGATLQESVSARLNAHAEDVEWDAYRTPEGRWVVTATYRAKAVGSWIFESVGRTVHPQDESARALMGGGPSVVVPEGQAPEDHRAREVPAPKVDQAPEAPRPRLVSVTSDPTAVSEVASQHGATQRSQDDRQEVLLDPTDSGSGPRRAKRSKGKKGRASVPSWDEILFGATRPED